MPERNLDFDSIIDRRGTKCLKYDFASKRGYKSDILPLWVADMDFKTSSYIEDALIEVAHHNIYGYTNTQDGDGFFEAIAGWMRQNHNWEVKSAWHVKTPGVCFAIANAIRAITKPSDAVIIQQPVYYPFSNIIRQNNRKLVVSNLKKDSDNNYEMDFDDFERKIIENQVKLFVLCNPHNPVGRAWTREELKKIGDICLRHGVVVFSDEIHFDYIWKGQHQIFQEVDTKYKDITITATSPSKTFNIAGIQQANIFIPNEELKKKFETEYNVSGLDEPNIFGVAATQAAYTKGQEWYQGVKQYISDNIDFAYDFVKNELPGVSMNKPEGTYLIWLDFTGTGLSDEKIDDLIINKAQLWLDSGRIFGQSGRGFQRINVTTQRTILEEALTRVKKSL